MLCLAAGCRSVPDDAAARAAVAAALERYQVAARLVHPDSVASHFTATGVLFEPGINPIRTRDSIRGFVASFPGVRVDLATATPDTIEVFGATAFVWGSYHERLGFPGQPDGTWLIERYYRVPLP